MLYNPFSVGHSLLGVGPAIKSGLLPRKTPSKEGNFPFVGGYQVEAASGLGMGVYILFSLPL